MDSTIPQDLTKNIITTIYLLISHNYLPIAYSFGLLTSLILSVYRPTRFSVLLLFGFALLLFGFEYDKHIIVPFREQTLKSLITETPHYKLQKLVNIIISDLLPILFFTFGWLAIYIAIIYKGIKKK